MKGMQTLKISSVRAMAVRYLPRTIAPGEIVGIVGRSGSGKSTLSKLVQRLYSPEQGRVLVDGVDIALVDASQLRRQIGVVLQDNVLFNRTVRENIAIADPAAPLDAVMAAAQLAGAHEFILELPQGYDTVVGEHGATLSGGQKQRISIARAILRNAPITIFDEATSNLDSATAESFAQTVNQLKGKVTMIFIAHQLPGKLNVDEVVEFGVGAVGKGEVT